MTTRRFFLFCFDDFLITTCERRHYCIFCSHPLICYEQRVSSIYSVSKVYDVSFNCTPSSKLYCSCRVVIKVVALQKVKVCIWFQKAL